MRIRNIKYITVFSLLLVFTLLMQKGYAQKMTRIKGTVVDSKTKEPLPFVNIVFVGKHVGTITDYSGRFNIETQWASDSLQASFTGYKRQAKIIIPGKTQVVNFELEPQSINLNEVVITTKRKKYRNKGNPAVELIKKVIKNKNLNRKESLDYYEYDKYEKVEFDLNNITDKFKSKKVFKDLQFIFEYVDTSKINDKPYLPVFLKETLSKVYYRKNPKSRKEYVSGTKMVGFHEYLDNQGISFIIENMFQDIDVYDNNITLLTNQFTSPISSFSPIIYKFFILDTVEVNGYDCINLAFQPRNKQDFAFTGNLYITNDDRYAVIKVDMKIPKEINLNFVNDLQIIQEFSFINNQCWMLTKDNLIVDFNFMSKGIGMFGRRSVFYDNYIFNKKEPEKIYKGVESIVREPGYTDRDSLFWKKNRLVPLSKKEENIYYMMNKVQTVPAFKRTMDIAMLFIAGYWNFGKFDLGPVNTFYSFNDVEGFRLRVGGRTSDKLSKRFRLEGYLMYGFKDKRFKYSISGTMSLNKRPLRENPKHYITAMYQVETNFPGMEMQFINEDNFLLSFKRGVSDKILYYDMYKIEHYLDWKGGFSTTLIFKNLKQEPGGTLYFNYDNYSVDNIVSSEITARLRFAPNEKFYQGMDYRVPIITKYPIFQLSYTQGIKGLFKADYTYSKITFNVFKRFYLSTIGFTNTEIEVGKIFGEVPFPLLHLPRANQTYSYQIRSYNMMNFLEFVTDSHVSLFVEHHFNGFIFNKIPLVKKLKWRAIISFKGLYGDLSDKNNPKVTPGLMKFPTDVDGNPTTFPLTGKPYIEVSAGIGNIFKFFRVDLLKRVTYLDNPNVPEYGVRMRFKIDF